MEILKGNYELFDNNHIAYHVQTVRYYSYEFKIGIYRIVYYKIVASSYVYTYGGWLDVF